MDLQYLRGGVAAAAFTAFVATTACAAPLLVDGQINSPSAGSYTIAQLQGLPSTTQTVGGDTYVGVSLWTLLGGTSGGASNIAPTGGGNNPILRSFVTATGADGKQSIISAGEINPQFGGTGSPYIVAYQQNGVTLTTPKLILPADATGTRNVTDLTALTVNSAPRPPIGPGGQSTQFTLSGVANPGTYNLAALQALPSVTFTGVSFLSGNPPSSNGPFTFKGVDLWDFLVAAGIGASDKLGSYLLVTGTDGFEVLLSLAELDPALSGRDYMIAYEVNGGGLGNAGFARLVLPGDLRGGRYVSNIASIELVQVPGPAGMALLGGGILALVGAVHRRRPSRR